MSHIHNIGGNAATAAEYQDYLARLRHGRQSKRTSEFSETRAPATFDSAIDPDAAHDEDREGGDEEAGESPEGSADGKTGAEGKDGHGLSAKA
jgi:hypothetical protein